MRTLYTRDSLPCIPYRVRLKLILRDAHRHGLQVTLGEIQSCLSAGQSKMMKAAAAAVVAFAAGRVGPATL